MAKEFKSDIKNIQILSEVKSGRVKGFMKISWNDGPFNWNIRQYDTENEKAFKGISLNDYELNELATRLIKEGYGDIDEIISNLSESLSGEEKEILNFEKLFEKEKRNKFSLKFVDGNTKE